MPAAGKRSVHRILCAGRVSDPVRRLGESAYIGSHPQASMTRCMEQSSGLFHAAGHDDLAGTDDLANPEFAKHLNEGVHLVRVAGHLHHE